MKPPGRIGIKNIQNLRKGNCDIRIKQLSRLIKEKIYILWLQIIKTVFYLHKNVSLIL